ncbi:hypothetical protein DV20_31155 [Amycolatopsis rifamycinica]|uniref:Uncharacterized protein n=1 Tax=Amycolatopsis rifamycinica TaxID=287986 RepID=A0A066U2G4_9PSEU|nr:hypothetical protein DV20_31155 [Amycolatopsis rifamycinica]
MAPASSRPVNAETFAIGASRTESSLSAIDVAAGAWAAWVRVSDIRTTRPSAWLIQATEDTTCSQTTACRQRGEVFAVTGSRLAERRRGHIGRDPGFAPDPPTPGLRPPEYAAEAAIRPGEYGTGVISGASRVISGASRGSSPPRRAGGLLRRRR